MFHLQKIDHKNMLPPGSLYEGKKVKIRNLSYVCLEKLKTLSHIDQKDHSIRHGVYFQSNSWIVQAEYNKMYYIMNGYKIVKASPYYLYNSKKLSNNTTVEELLEKCGVYEEALRHSA